MPDCYDRWDRFYDEVQDGVASSPAHCTALRQDAFYRRFKRAPTGPEMYAMGLTFADLLTPAEIAEGNRIRAAGSLDFVFAAERAYEK